MGIDSSRAIAPENITCGDHLNYTGSLAANSIAEGCSLSSFICCAGFVKGNIICPWRWVVIPGALVCAFRFIPNFIDYLLSPNRRSTLIRELAETRPTFPGWSWTRNVDWPTEEERSEHLDWTINQGLARNREAFESQRQMINRQTGIMSV